MNQPDCLAYEHAAFLRPSFSHRREIVRAYCFRHRTMLRLSSLP